MTLHTAINSDNPVATQEAEAHNPAVEMEMWAVMEYCNRGTLQSGVDKVRPLADPKPCRLTGALPGCCGHARINLLLPPTLRSQVARWY